MGIFETQISPSPKCTVMYEAIYSSALWTNQLDSSQNKEHMNIITQIILKGTV